MPDQFWYYHETEYLEEGVVFPFHSKSEAEAHVHEDGCYRLADEEGDKPEVTVGRREATEEEQAMIDYGRRLERDKALTTSPDEEIEIIVNGRTKKVKGGEIVFREVVDLAFDKYPGQVEGSP
jgi:hypothetical protein